ncbi:MAG: hypothetical protein CMH57_07180, partial [Myxococcales bacterium]|nr:hypothetical protein [Myxococcales bacterium]
HQLTAAQRRLSELTHHLSEEEARKQETSDRLQAATAEAGALLARFGVTPEQVARATRQPGVGLSESEQRTIRATLPDLKPLEIVRFTSWEGYQRDVADYMERHALDTDRDPLAQILSPHQLAELERRFHIRFGDTRWTPWDYGVVGLAALIAVVVDIVLVAIPKDMKFLGQEYTGSPITKRFTAWAEDMRSDAPSSPFLAWLGSVQGHLEGWAKVTYDLSINNKTRGIQVDGLRPGTHRMMSLGHDPALGFIFGTLENMAGCCSLIDRSGRLQFISNPAKQDLNPLRSMAKVAAHLLSDLPTSAGVQPPFFTLVQLLNRDSGLTLKPGGATVTWTDAARWMYTNGYTMGHFATMSLVPALVELILRTYIWLTYRDALQDDSPQAHLGHEVKLASMRTMAHTLVMGGDLLKVHLYGLNPAAFNWSQMLALAKAAVATIQATRARDAAIEEHLLNNWTQLLRHGRSPHQPL